MTTFNTALAPNPTASEVQPYSRAFLIRAFEERLLKLFSEGKLFGTVHTCIGQEFTGVAVAAHMIPGDLIFSNHRCHGHYLARTGDAEGMMAEVMGRVTGICQGRGGSQHICHSGVYSNGIQGGIVPVAFGQHRHRIYRGRHAGRGRGLRGDEHRVEVEPAADDRA